MYKRTLLFLLIICGGVLFSGCGKNNLISEKNILEIPKNTTPSKEIISSTTGDKIHKEILNIVGTSIPNNQNIELFLSDYLTSQGLKGYIIEKQLSKGDILTISMKEKSQEYCHFEAGGCITFILKDKKLIWSNAINMIDLLKNNNYTGNQGGGRVYRYTKNGVILEIQNGEGLGCIDGISYTFLYINIDTLKTLWSVLNIIHEGKSPDSTDERCENKNTKWIKKEFLSFFKTYEDSRNNKNLDIIANSTEEAFYQYNN